MNKTVTINISGIVFHIEEDAYQRLKNYLDSLRVKFHAEEGRDEILADIESRIAEILTQKKGPAREVVMMADIDEVIAVMGEPEAISDESNTQSESQSQSQSSGSTREENYQRRTRRRLFRDPDDKVVGGVCSGIAHYFDIDPVWIRLGFALLFFVGGTGILFYLLLMIIIPRALTTAEKLEMHGEPVDVNNIRRTIKEEFEEFGNRMKGFGKEARDWGKAGYDNTRNRSRYHRRGAEDFLRGMFHVVGRFFAFLLVLFGVLFLIGLLIGAFSVTDFGPDVITNQVRLLFDDTESYYVGIIAALIVFGMPILMMIYSGIRILFRLPRNNKWVGFTALGVWVIGIVMGVFSIINIAEGFSESSEVVEHVRVLDAKADTISIRVYIDEDMRNNGYRRHWDIGRDNERHWKMIHANNNDVKFGYAGLNIVPATGDSIELVLYKQAQGRTIAEAKDRVGAIRYTIAQDSGEIIFPAAFTIGDNQAWKVQQIDGELRLPIGTVVFIDATCRGLLYDVANVTNTYDDDMVDRRWVMTANGLKCIDCAGLGVHTQEEEQKKADRHIDSIMKADTAWKDLERKD